MENWRSDTVNTLNDEYDHKRDDYKEFADLCLVFLGDKDQINFRKPGAVHKARWMAKLLYAIKICLLEDPILELAPGTIATRQQFPKVQKFVIFATLIYSSWWFKCECAVDAPWNDLQLYHKMLEYEGIDPAVARSAIRAFDRHLWYLTVEMVPLSLFSSAVLKEDKQALADRLLVVRPKEGLK